ncbi:MAG TPA: hypothetical protein DCS83_08945 [Prevotella sp.]|nr:hypothetical protein [Prevotella sp.]
MDIKQYRQAITDILANSRDEEGNIRMTEQEIHEILDDFSDEELEDGMLFNSPEDVAEIILEG